MKVLFISWDGPQVTYLEGLFLPIFSALQAKGFQFHVLQFTWSDAISIQRTRAAYKAAGVGYRAVRVLRHPKTLGAIFTAWRGSLLIARDIRRLGIDVVMPRSILPAFAALVTWRIGRTPIVFDADGLAVDERLEFAPETTSPLQSWVMRDVEVKAVRRASVVLTRTARAATVLHARAGAGTALDKFHVVGNGRDPRQFHPLDQEARDLVRTRLGISLDAPLLVYVGSMGPQYCPVQMLQLFARVLQRRPDAHFLVLSSQGELLREMASSMALPAAAMTVIAVEVGDVPEYLACADFGLALRVPSFSMEGVAPIKLGEYLLCGVPVVVSSVIANADLIGDGTGIHVNGMNEIELDQTAKWMTEEVLKGREGFRQRCMALGRASFSLEQSVDAYVRALESVKNLAGDQISDAASRSPHTGAAVKNDRGKRASSKAAVLYLSYDGMLEPLGQSQVLAYLEELAKTRSIHLVSFEKAEDWADVTLRGHVRSRMDAAGIHWHPRRYHKQPSSLATGWDIVNGTASALWLVLRHRVGIVHARSYVAGIMAWTVTKVTGARFLFDMRGFWADERLDGGLWPRDGRMYRMAKWCERQFLLSADHVVSLTHAGIREMQAFDYLQARMPPITVIPTCADLKRFQLMPAQPQTPFVLGYVGSAGTWYLFDATVACFVQLRTLRPDARMLIVNRNEHAYIHARLLAGGVPSDAYELRSANHSEIPAQMARMHATAFFIKPVFSKQASAPTKLAEFLGCGIPCLSNSGVGDMAQILEGDRVGVAVDSFEPAELLAGLQRLLALLEEPDIHERCVVTAQRNFSLEQGVSSYLSIYAALATAD